MPLSLVRDSVGGMQEVESGQMHQPSYKKAGEVLQ